MSVLPNQQKDALEGLIDRFSLADVLDTLSCIVADKAAHISENWQDERLARVWTQAMQPIDSAALAARRRGI